MATTEPSLQGQVKELERENRELKRRLAKLEKRDEAVLNAQKRLLRGSWRLLLPMVDRQKVVRSFSKMAQTLSDFANEREQWPAKEQVLADSREFMESCVRFVIRRRTLAVIIAIIAITVPAFQIWLVVEQNRIIEIQTDMAEIQVYDVVSRTMTEGDRNARQMTGALLANAKLGFLGGVIEEAFGRRGQDVYRSEGLSAAKRRLEDAAFRGYLIRGVDGGIDRQRRKGDMSVRELYQQARPMVRTIFRDSSHRVRLVLRLGRQNEGIEDDMAEQVDFYITQVGLLLRTQSRLARTARREEEFFEDARPIFEQVSKMRTSGESRFDLAYRTSMQSFLYDLALEPEFGAESVSVSAAGKSPEKALREGINRLREGLGNKAVNWGNFEQQVKLR